MVPQLWAGGHSTEILRRLSKEGRLWAFDLDPNAVAVGQKLEALEPRFKMMHRPFADVHVTWMADLGQDLGQLFGIQFFFGVFLGLVVLVVLD